MRVQTYPIVAALVILPFLASASPIPPSEEEVNLGSGTTLVVVSLTPFLIGWHCYLLLIQLD